MQLRNKQRSTTRTRTACTALAMLLALLAGCAGGGRKVEPVSAEQPPSVREKTAVMRLEGGREGFAIRETPEMDGESRRDFERAVTRMKESDYQKAVELLEKVIERAPGVTAPYIDIAMAYARIEKPEQAEHHLKAALTLVPGHPAASNEYGLLLRKSGRFAEAREIYEESLSRFPEYLPVHRNLGILCDLYLGDPECAIEQYEIYSEGNPGDEQVKMWIADLRLRSGR